MRLNFEMCMKSAVMTSFLAAPDGDGVLPSVTLGFGQFGLGLAIVSSLCIRSARASVCDIRVWAVQVRTSLYVSGAAGALFSHTPIQVVSQCKHVESL
jgi:hypothetical protein